MARPFFTIWILVGVLSVLGLGCSKPQPDEIVAVVDDKIIRVGDLQNVLNREKNNYSTEKFKNKKSFLKIKQKVLSDLIDHQLLLRQAMTNGAGISDRELQRELQLFKNQYTEMSFQNMLDEVGISQQEWVQTKRENLLIKKFLKGEGEEEKALDPTEIRKFYEENQELFIIPESVRVRQIVTDSKEKAESILRRLRNGENFAKLAKDLSMSPDRKKGGDLGFIPKGSFPREFEVCFHMNPGEISPIIPSLYGFHLFKVLEKAPQKTLRLEEVQDRIVVMMKQRGRQQKREDLLQSLHQKATVTIHEEILERVAL